MTCSVKCVVIRIARAHPIYCSLYAQHAMSPFSPWCQYFYCEISIFNAMVAFYTIFYAFNSRDSIGRTSEVDRPCRCHKSSWSRLPSSVSVGSPMTYSTASRTNVANALNCSKNKNTHEDHVGIERRLLSWEVRPRQWDKFNNIRNYGCCCEECALRPWD